MMGGNAPLLSFCPPPSSPGWPGQIMRRRQPWADNWVWGGRAMGFSAEYSVKLIGLRLYELDHVRSQRLIFVAHGPNTNGVA